MARGRSKSRSKRKPAGRSRGLNRGRGRPAPPRRAARSGPGPHQERRLPSGQASVAPRRRRARHRPHRPCRPHRAGPLVPSRRTVRASLPGDDEGAVRAGRVRLPRAGRGVGHPVAPRHRSRGPGAHARGACHPDVRRPGGGFSGGRESEPRRRVPPGEQGGRRGRSHRRMATVPGGLPLRRGRRHLRSGLPRNPGLHRHAPRRRGSWDQGDVDASTARRAPGTIGRTPQPGPPRASLGGGAGRHRITSP